MNKIKQTVMALAILMLGTSAVNAQVKDNAIKFNLLGAFAGQYQFAYERAINENITVQLGAGAISRSYSFVGSKSSTSGFIVLPEARYYFKESMKGLYAGAFARIRSTTYKYEYNDLSTYNWNYKQSRFAVGGGLVLGFQILAGDVFVIDIFAGPQYKSASTTTTYEDPTQQDNFILDASGADNSGPGLRLGFNIGAAF